MNLTGMQAEDYHRARETYRDLPSELLWQMLAERDYALKSSDQPKAAQPLPKAAADVVAEREHQQSDEGWTAEHDDKHVEGEIAAAAGTYALVASCRFSGVARLFWPWDFEGWRPCDRRRNLVKAGALIIAEIERLDRAEASK